MNIQLTKEQEEHLVKLYQEGMKTIDLCREFGWKQTNRHGPLDILKKYNISIREDQKTASTKYTLNRDYFKKIDSSDKAYFLGLIYADGSCRYDGKEMKLALKDKEILEIMNKYIASNKPLRLLKAKQISHSDSHILCIEVLEVVTDLINLGVNPNKSYTLEFPKTNIVPLEFLHHFIRGYFDGDGSVTHGGSRTHKGVEKKDVQVNFSSTRKMLESIREVMSDELNFNNKIKISQRYKDKKDVSCQITYGGNKQMLKLYNWLYRDCNNLYIERKKKKFEELLNISPT